MFVSRRRVADMQQKSQREPRLGGVEAPSELLVEGREQVPVGVKADLVRAMPEPGLNEFWVRLLGNHQGRCRVPQIVEPKRGKPCSGTSTTQSANNHFRAPR